MVFGCSGQDGALISRSLLRKNYEVIGTSRSNEPNKAILKALKIDKEIRIIKNDLNNIHQTRTLIDEIKPNCIYNFSAQSSVGRSFSYPLETQLSIVNATSTLLEACRLIDYDGSVFFAGSSEMYGDSKSAINYNSKIDLRSPYAAAKYQSYLLVKTYRELYKLKAFTGILFNHESPWRNENFISHKIILGAIECSRNKSHKVRLGNINISRDWGWANEYIEAIQIISNAEGSKDYVICTGKLTSLKEFINIAFSSFDLNWQDHIILDKSLIRSKDIMRSWGDPSQLKADLNWEAKVHVGEIIENLIQSEISNL